MDDEGVGAGGEDEATVIGGEGEEAKGGLWVEGGAEVEEEAFEAARADAREGLAAEGSIEGGRGEEQGDAAAEVGVVVSGGGRGGGGGGEGIGTDTV